ncbi:glycoside hydrolase [Bacteroidia bacterium]|nr:glycoside hydrolase [Bacteroidia bacterium]
MEQKLDIAYILHAFPVLSQTFIVNQIIDMMEREHNLSIYSLYNIPPPYHQCVIDSKLIDKTNYIRDVQSKRELFGIILHFLFSSPKLCWGVLSYILKVKLKEHQSLDTKLLLLANELRSNDFDIIHAHFGHTGAAIAQLKQWGLLPKAKLITTFHGYDIHKPFLKHECYTSLFKTGDLFTVNSTFSMKQLIDLDCPIEKIYKLPVGLNIHLFQVLSSKNKTIEGIRILFIGRLMALKGPNRVVEICNELKNRNIKFNCIIIGSGELHDTITESIQTYRLEQSVQLIESITQENLIPVMNNSDVFLYPGIYDSDGRAETQGLVIQEAQAMKLPVLIPDVGGMQEGILPNITGFVMEENSINAFADKIEYLYQNEDIRLKMGDAARNFVSENYSIHRLGDKLEKLYMKMS